MAGLWKKFNPANDLYDQPLAYRGTIAPFGTYTNPDGSESAGFAWPGMITEPLNALQRLHEHSYTEDGRLGIPNPQYQGNKDDALTALLSIYAGNALNPATRLPENALGMFAGRNAKTANLKALSRAEDMAGKGASREDIWNDTGWFQGPDQKWRFEIDDSGQRLLKMPDDLSKIDRPIASDMVFKHDALHEAYPAVADTPWYYTPNIDGGGASYDATRGIRVSSAPSLSYDTGGIGGVTLHEQQHAIQQIEDFARGGNREMGHKLDDVKREAQQAYEATARKQASGIRTADDELLAELGISEPVASKPWDGLSLREQLEWYDAGRGRVYNRLSGETEARNVQTRMNMSAEERRATPPWETQDVPDDQQIVRFLSDTGKPSPVGAALAGENANAVKAWHSTPAKFDTFDNAYTDEVGFHFGSKNQAHNRAYVESGGNPWTYFTKWRDIPVEMDVKNPANISRDVGQFNGENVARQLVKDSIAPIDLLANVMNQPEAARNAAVRNWLVENGYDAVKYPNRFEGVGDPSYMMLNTGNVKHARTGETLYSDTVKPSLMGSAVSSTIHDDSNSGAVNDPAWLEDFLRRYY